MKQQDFQGRQGAFAPKRRPQTQTFQPQSIPFPQPSMQGGNYAPQPIPASQQGNSAMFGQAPVQANSNAMPGYENLYREYYNTNKSIRNVMSNEQAMEQLDEMDDMIAKINNMDGLDTGIDIGSIDKLVMLIGQVATQLRDPKLWLPESRVADYAEQLSIGGNKIADALTKYAEKINLLKVK